MNRLDSIVLCATLWWVWRSRNEDIFNANIMQLERVVRFNLLEAATYSGGDFIDANPGISSKDPRLVRWS